jgi:hypothetical protein
MDYYFRIFISDHIKQGGTMKSAIKEWRKINKLKI